MALYKKIHDIMCESEGLEKSMTVGFGNSAYKAIGEAAVLNNIKPLLKKYGLVMFPVNVDVENTKEIFTTAKGESVRLMTQVVATYKLVDVDTGEFEILMTVGHGVDTQDKASGKALTYGYKALLQKTFCLFSGEDTDNEHSDAITERNTAPKQSPPAQAAPSKPGGITENQVKRLFAIAKANGVDPANIKTDMMKNFNKTSTSDLTKKEYDELIERIEGKQATA